MIFHDQTPKKPAKESGQGETPSRFVLSETSVNSPEESIRTLLSYYTGSFPDFKHLLSKELSALSEQPE